MSNTKVRSNERRRADRRHELLATLAAVVVLGAAGVAIATTMSGGTADSVYVRTGETNDMGMPVLKTPGTSSGTAMANGVTASPSTWSMGLVPLNVAVRPTWTIHNTGTDAITIGKPTVQINQGCCPGPFTIKGSSTLAPGAAADLSFELAMHPGMDGLHDMTLSVPVTHADGSTDRLTLSVTGDFRS